MIGHLFQTNRNRNSLLHGGQGHGGSVSASSRGGSVVGGHSEEEIIARADSDPKLVKLGRADSVHSKHSEDSLSLSGGLGNSGSLIVKEPVTSPFLNCATPLNVGLGNAPLPALLPRSLSKFEVLEPVEIIEQSDKAEIVKTKTRPQSAKSTSSKDRKDGHENSRKMSSRPSGAGSESIFNFTGNTSQHTPNKNSTRDPNEILKPSGSPLLLTEIDDEDDDDETRHRSVFVTPLCSLPNAKIIKYLGMVTVHLVKETTSLKREYSDSIELFYHTFVAEALEIAKAQVYAAGGNCYLSFSISNLQLGTTDNRAYALINCSGDAALAIHSDGNGSF